ncbi:MAG: hypothetical protein JOZ42_15170 [Acetobacteraceae bacterium]|nr:hypothetical protein [Acetobacteraceae bacterium]
MKRFSIPLAAFAFAAAAALAPIGAHAADTDSTHRAQRANNEGTDAGSTTPVTNPRPGAGAMTGSHSDTTSAPAAGAPPTNQPSAPVGH